MVVRADPSLGIHPAWQSLVYKYLDVPQHQPYHCVGPKVIKTKITNSVPPWSQHCRQVSFASPANPNELEVVIAIPGHIDGEQLVDCRSTICRDQCWSKPVEAASTWWITIQCRLAERGRKARCG